MSKSDGVLHLHGVRALQTNINAALGLFSVIRTSLGPRSMCKMLVGRLISLRLPLTVC